MERVVEAFAGAVAEWEGRGAGGAAFPDSVYRRPAPVGVGMKRSQACSVAPT